MKHQGVKPYETPGGQAFRMSPQSDAVKQLLGDPDVSTWDCGFQENLHALVLMAHDDLVELLQIVN